MPLHDDLPLEALTDAALRSGQDLDRIEQAVHDGVRAFFRRLRTPAQAATRKPRTLRPPVEPPTEEEAARARAELRLAGFPIGRSTKAP